MTTPRVTVPVEPGGVSPVYSAAYDSIRKGAPGLSDATCAVIARSINMKVALLSAAPAPEGGEVWKPHQITPNDIAAILEENADCSDEGGGLLNASQLAEKIWRTGLSALATRSDDKPEGGAVSPAEAGEDDLAARLRRAETWDLDADQEARDRCGVLMLEAAERLEALRPQPQGRSQVSEDDAKWLLENYGPTSPRIERIANVLLSQPPARIEARDCGNGHQPGCDCDIAEEDVARSKPPAREGAQPGAGARLARAMWGVDLVPSANPAPDALREANLWWNAEDWEQTFNSLEDAYDEATGGEMRGVAKLGRATEHDPVWALRIDFDTTGDGEADDYEIRLFKSVDDAHAYLAALQAEQKGGAA